ncbi:DNA topoisomerase 2 [Tanacetum coccineum]
MYKIFDEILVDAAAGNKQRYPKVTHIKVDIDVDHNRISVWTNTLDMDVMNANRDLSESFWGSSESSFFLTESVIDTVFTRNMRTRHISFSNDGINSTMVSFKPDLAKFGMDRLENDTVSLMKRRVVDLAGCLGKGVKVELDGTCVLPSTFEDYVKLYPETSSIYEKVNDRLEVSVGVADGHFEQVSFVNNIANGGPHVDYITDQIITYLAKIMNLEPNYIKSHLWVFVNALIDNPAFDSETKENLTTNKGSFGSTFETSDVVTSFLSKADFYQNKKLEKTDGKRKWKINNPELVDAYFAATAYSEDCTLILTQGASAEAFARCGVSAVGQVYYGMFPLRYGKTYENVKELRYGHLMIMADPDHNGSHFKRLLINFLHSLWPSLLKVPNFMLDFIAPIVKASNKETNDVLLFYTMPEYEAWKEKLQACETKEVAEYFADLDNYTKNFFWDDDEDDYAIERAFSEEKIQERRDWLRAHQLMKIVEDDEAGAAIDSKEKHIRYRDFINKGLILFSRALRTGWSSFVPNYNPRDIIANLIRLLNGKAMVRMDPWYKCFNGAILKTEDTRYITEGLIEEINSKSALRITELPVRRWTREYKEFLKAARQGGEHKTPFIKAYTTHHDHTIEILMTEDQMTTARQEGFVKKFKLTTELSASDMHLFDAKGVLKKYDTPEQILKEFFDLRLEFYEEIVSNYPDTFKCQKKLHYLHLNELHLLKRISVAVGRESTPSETSSFSILRRSSPPTFE